MLCWSMPDRALGLDEIGYWSEVKLAILREYGAAYSKILAAQPFIRGHAYIDAFAGAGTHVSKTSGELVTGSPMLAVQTRPEFTDLYFVDLDGTRVDELRKLTEGDARVHVLQGDCNEILLRDVFPRCRYEDYRRALCVLDPYSLNVSWEVLASAGRMKSIEIFYNFMIMDANMKRLHAEPGARGR
jgi:three-Cys-motif partner protein